VRKFAFEYAVALNIKFPERWKDMQMAGAEWFTKFMKRHKTLSLRKPEATSISTASSFNKTLQILAGRNEAGVCYCWYWFVFIEYDCSLCLACVMVWSVVVSMVLQHP
jgi:hypothetical protein